MSLRFLSTSEVTVLFLASSTEKTDVGKYQIHHFIIGNNIEKPRINWILNLNSIPAMSFQISNYHNSYSVILYSVSSHRGSPLHSPTLRLWCFRSVTLRLAEWDWENCPFPGTWVESRPILVTRTLLVALAGSDQNQYNWGDRSIINLNYYFGVFQKTNPCLWPIDNERRRRPTTPRSHPLCTMERIQLSCCGW